MYFIGIRNVVQTQDYLSVTSEWSYDTFGEFYRRKTKSFEFLQKETPIEAFVKGLKQPFFQDTRKRKCKISSFNDTIVKLKKMDTPYGSPKGV